MMTVAKCREVLDRYEQILQRDYVWNAGSTDDGRANYAHLRTMIPRMRVMLDEVDATGNQYAVVNVPRMEKFMRWLGFLQGALWNMAIFTLDELKAHNKPDGA